MVSAGGDGKGFEVLVAAVVVGYLGSAVVPLVAIVAHTAAAVVLVTFDNATHED